MSGRCNLYYITVKICDVPTININLTQYFPTVTVVTPKRGAIAAPIPKRQKKNQTCIAEWGF